VPLIVLAGRLRMRSKPQVLQPIPNTFRAPCPSAAAVLPKGAAKREKEMRKGVKG
jgi:hypothetical protein